LRDSGRGTDGVIAKQLARPYQSGERAMVKVKRLRTADCVVGGFRYESGSRGIGSLLLGLFDAHGKLDHVGYTAGMEYLRCPRPLIGNRFALKAFCDLF
jgi:ATP-dependent DNA ligase